LRVAGSDYEEERMSTESVFTDEEFADRHRRLRERMANEGLDAIVGYSNPKAKGVVRWLSNYYVRFTGMQSKRDGSYFQFGSCAVLFPRDGEPTLLTDQTWDVARAEEISVFADTRHAFNFGTEFAAAIDAAGYGKVGIDNWFLFPAMHYLPLVEGAPKASFEPTHVVEETYKVKSPKEIELTRKAEEVAVKAVAAGFAAVDVGVREYDFALAAENEMRKHGELETAGSSIIMGGPKTATGSGLPMQEGSYVMKSGDWALFDCCPSYCGYAADICRMVVAGKLSDLDPRLKKMYDVTLRMNEEVIDRVKAGARPGDLNAFATEIAEREGFGEQKIELLGHGLGPDMHDPPDYYYDDTPLEENMTITIEPCLLEPGVGGVRVEDVVLVTADGCEVLTEAAPKQLHGTAD
jgi:Xaa-Pro aminopeptidase